MRPRPARGATAHENMRVRGEGGRSALSPYARAGEDAHLLVLAVVPVVSDEGLVVGPGEVEHVARLPVHEPVQLAALYHACALLWVECGVGSVAIVIVMKVERRC